MGPSTVAPTSLAGKFSSFKGGSHSSWDVRLSLGSLRTALYLLIAVGKASALGIPADECVQPFTTPPSRVRSCRIQYLATFPSLTRSAISKPRMLINYLFSLYGTTPDKNNQRKFYFSSWFEKIQSPPWWESKVAGRWAGWSHDVHTQEAERVERWCSVLVTVLILGAGCRMMPHTFRMGLPSLSTPDMCGHTLPEVCLLGDPKILSCWQ